MPEGGPPSQPEHARLVIVGGGPAGLTAAIYAARAELEPVVLAGHLPGGQLMLTQRVENFPGFPSGIEGPALMSRFRRQAERFGGRVLEIEAERLDLSRSPYLVSGSGGRSFLADALVISTGARTRSLGLPNEERLLGRGVSTCGTCDGAFFRDQEVVVVGGGDAAAEEAIGLGRIAARVHLVHRGRELRASRVLQSRLAASRRVEVLTSAEVVAIHGEQRVEGLDIATRDGTRRRLAATGLFVAIGLDPATELLRSWLPIGADGYLEDGAVRRIGGVFVAGDVTDRDYRQAVTAAADGCRAALDAERWLVAHAARPSRQAAGRRSADDRRATTGPATGGRAGAVRRGSDRARSRRPGSPQCRVR